MNAPDLTAAELDALAANTAHDTVGCDRECCASCALAFAEATGNLPRLIAMARRAGSLGEETPDEREVRAEAALLAALRTASPRLIAMARRDLAAAKGEKP